MARKAVVDTNIVLQMLQEGKTTREVAENFNVSRQAIDLHRKRFIKEGLLQEKRAKRIKDTIESQKPTSGIARPKYSLEELIDLVLEAFTALKRIPDLEADLEKYKNDNEKAMREIEQLKQAEEKRSGQEERWQSIQKQNNQLNLKLD